jgi:2-C-methyl-D-erythritol 2,4-cyclodiphosphate synthase
LILGGVEIPYERGLLGHSDADVLIHALMDALLGALALGDIGTHFPDHDDRYAGISSLYLLEKVVKLIQDQGYCIGNIDTVIVAERPKLASYILQMRLNLAQALSIEPEKVSVKATTTERLGFEGRGEGIGAEAIVSLEKING